MGTLILSSVLVTILLVFSTDISSVFGYNTFSFLDRYNEPIQRFLPSHSATWQLLLGF